jgi:hypothetical protein
LITGAGLLITGAGLLITGAGLLITGAGRSIAVGPVAPALYCGLQVHTSVPLPARPDWTRAPTCSQARIRFFFPLGLETTMIYTHVARKGRPA